METEYDLAVLSEELGANFPEIKELYLFGSRAQGTKSSRSDADVLVVTSSYIKPLLLRQFSSENCEALDLFIVDDGEAISTQNESRIKFRNLSELLKNLNAVKIWSRTDGRQHAQIEWRFKVHEGTEFVPSVLPITTKDKKFDASKLTVKDVFEMLTISQLWKIGGAIIFVLSIVGGFGYWLGGVLN